MSLLRLCFIVESGTDVRLVEGLASEFDLVIIARKIPGGAEISQEMQTPVPVFVGPTNRGSFSRFVWSYLWKHSEQTDVVLVQGYGISAFVTNLFARIKAIPAYMLVCSPAEAYYECRRENPFPGKPFYRIERTIIGLLARFNAILGKEYIVLSESLAEVIRKRTRRHPIHVIPIYGVDTGMFSPSRESKSSLRQRLGLPSTGSLIFFSSRVSPEKDSRTLLFAFRQLRNGGRDLWLLHRSGNYRTLLQQAEQVGISERIIATDAVHPHDRLPLDYQASDLCIQASLQEGLGFSALEALACGIPVIASRVGGLKETIIDGQTGWTYPPGSASELALCIENALQNPDEAARRAASGREMVLEKYDRRKVFAQLVELIQPLMNPSHSNVRTPQ